METKKFTDGRTDAEGYNIIRPFFKRAYKKRKEKRKYVARPGIEPRTPDLRVRCPTDCATWPGSILRESNNQQLSP